MPPSLPPSLPRLQSFRPSSFIEEGVARSISILSLFKAVLGVIVCHPSVDLRPPTSPFSVGGYFLAEPVTIMSGHGHGTTQTNKQSGAPRAGAVFVVVVVGLIVESNFRRTFAPQWPFRNSPQSPPTPVLSILSTIAMWIEREREREVECIRSGF